MFSRMPYFRSPGFGLTSWNTTTASRFLPEFFPHRKIHVHADANPQQFLGSSNGGQFAVGLLRAPAICENRNVTNERPKRNKFSTSNVISPFPCAAAHLSRDALMTEIGLYGLTRGPTDSPEVSRTHPRSHGFTRVPTDSPEVGLDRLKHLPADGVAVRVEADLDHAVGGAVAPVRVLPSHVEVLDRLVWVPSVPVPNRTSDSQGVCQIEVCPRKVLVETWFVHFAI